MENSNRRLLLIIGGISLFVCACIAIAALVGSGLFFWTVASPSTSVEDPVGTSLPEIQPSPALEVEETSPSSSSPSQTPQQNATLSPTEAGPGTGSNLPGEITRQMDEIQKQVIDLRGLRSNGSVERALLTPEQLRDHVMNNFLADYTSDEARDDVIFYSQLGLLEPDFDLQEFFLELYSEQVAGFYDDETKEMYVVRGEGFEGPERLTYAHEYTHALQDQNYDFEDGLNFNDEACDENTERCAALQALIEGDASATEFEWFVEHGTQEELLQIQEFFENFESPIFDSAPSFMREDFIFPYNYGQSFVENLRSRGDWEAVDRVYQAPPVSTEQILHPERYPEDEPVPVTIPDLAPIFGEGWREVDRDTLGEWYTFLLLAHGLQENTRVEASTAQSAAEGWEGDAYVVYHNDETGQSALVLDTLWESENDAGEFGDAFREYAGNRFGESSLDDVNLTAWENSEAATEFRVDGQRTVWVLAPNADLLQAISTALQGQ